MSPGLGSRTPCCAGAVRDKLASVATSLTHELRVFEQLRITLLRAEQRDRYVGRFVVLKGDDVIVAFETGEIAYAAGVQRFGVQPMLVRQVMLVEQPEFLLSLLQLDEQHAQRRQP